MSVEVTKRVRKPLKPTRGMTADMLNQHKHIKYLYVCKVQQQRNYTMSRYGRRLYSKIYGLAYMTDDNEYVVHEFHCRNHALSQKNVEKLGALITSGHILDQDTEVVVTGRFEHDDLVMLFLHILHLTNRMSIYKVPHVQMSRTINKYVRYIRCSHFDDRHKARLFQRLWDMERLEFLPGDFMLRLSIMTESKKKLHTLCATGIYYMYVKQQFRQMNEKVKLRKEQKENKENNNEKE